MKSKVSLNTIAQEADENKRFKRDSRHTINDDDTATDWIPEIPFWNVSIRIKQFA